MFFDIRGQLNSMYLADSKALWPLFEAVSMQFKRLKILPIEIAVKFQFMRSANPM